MKKFLLALCLMFSLGCAAPQITIPMGQAAIAWGEVRSDYATGKAIVTFACVGGKIDKAGCEALSEIDKRAQVKREVIEKSLANPSTPVDWGQVMSYMSSVTEMMIKLGVLVAK